MAEEHPAPSWRTRDEPAPGFNQALWAEMQRRGYRVVVSEDGTEERVLRPDGSVAVVARRRQ